MINTLGKTAKKILLQAIKVYQKTKPVRRMINRLLFIPQGTCRYLPTCSDYMYQAIGKYGVMKGLFLGFKRILKCHPFAKSGHDPVP